MERELAELADKHRVDFSRQSFVQNGLTYEEWFFVPFVDDWGHGIQLIYLKRKPWFEINKYEWP